MYTVEAYFAFNELQNVARNAMQPPAAATDCITITRSRVDQ